MPCLLNLESQKNLIFRCPKNSKLCILCYLVGEVAGALKQSSDFANFCNRKLETGSKRYINFMAFLIKLLQNVFIRQNQQFVITIAKIFAIILFISYSKCHFSLNLQFFKIQINTIKQGYFFDQFLNPSVLALFTIFIRQFGHFQKMTQPQI